MTYLWPDGEAIHVEVDETGRPAAFVWQGEQHPVLTIANQWRIDEAWWTERVWRQCYKLTTTTGRLVVLYQDLLSGAWFLLRLYN